VKSRITTGINNLASERGARTILKQEKHADNQHGRNPQKFWKTHNNPSFIF